MMLFIFFCFTFVQYSSRHWFKSLNYICFFVFVCCFLFFFSYFFLRFSFLINLSCWCYCAIALLIETFCFAFFLVCLSVLLFERRFLIKSLFKYFIITPPSFLHNFFPSLLFLRSLKLVELLYCYFCCFCYFC